MPKKVENERGKSAQYMTRNQALRKLQVSLKDFRRLCILKGIFPRDPKKKLFGNEKTYYHKKDIAFLSHEPLLDKFRELKIILRKRKRAIARKEYDKATKLYEDRPKLDLHHLIRERYPTFPDALRDLDDALTMINLFANLPSGTISYHGPEHIAFCQNIVQNWTQYLIRTQSLKKVFVSIKGYYYQANINGEVVTWLAPHLFTQSYPHDVDFRVMFTFLEFYLTLLKFVLFKLYNDIGITYSPLIIGSIEDKADKKNSEDTNINTDAKQNLNKSNDNPLIASIQDKLAEIKPELEIEENDEDNKSKIELQHGIFTDLIFSISREVPSAPLELIILSACGKIISQDDESTPHYLVIDRPITEMKNDIQYVQPQWVFDSFNNNHLLPSKHYRPGVQPPPHLSPFVDDKKSGYIPYQKTVIAEWTGQNLSEGEMELVDEGSISSEEDIEDEVKESDTDEEDKPIKKTKKRKNTPDVQLSRAKLVMSKKASKLHSRMTYGIEKKEEAIQNLKNKRRKISKISQK